MRSVYEIQKDIDKATNLLNNLILEKKLTQKNMAWYGIIAKIQAEKLIKRCKEDCGK